MHSCSKTVVYVNTGEYTKTNLFPVVVRIPTHGKKINYLKSTIAQSSTLQQTKNKLKGELQKSVEKDQKNFAMIHNGFRKSFDWSEVYFVPDTMYRKFKSGGREVFVSQSGTSLDSLDIGHDYYLILINQDSEQLLLCDKNGNRLPSPYPYKKNTLLPAFKKIFNKEKYINDQIKYLNDHLHLAINILNTKKAD